MGVHQSVGPPDDLGVLQPRMLHDLLCGDHLLRADLEKLGHQVLGRPGDGVKKLRVELEVGGGYLSPEVEATLPVLAERWSPGQQDVEDHAEGPAVNLQGVGAVLSWSPPQGRCTAGSQSTS